MATLRRVGTSNSQGRTTSVAAGRSCRTSCCSRAETGRQSLCIMRPVLEAGPFGPAGGWTHATRTGRSARLLPFDCRIPRLLAVSLSEIRSIRAKGIFCAQTASEQQYDGSGTVSTRARGTATRHTSFPSRIALVASRSGSPELAKAGASAMLPSCEGGGCSNCPAGRTNEDTPDPSRHVAA